jgi:hypothetical protein
MRRGQVLWQDSQTRWCEHMSAYSTTQERGWQRASAIQILDYWPPGVETPLRAGTKGPP